jgi:hypothetical protein
MGFKALRFWSPVSGEPLAPPVLSRVAQTGVVYGGDQAPRYHPPLAQTQHTDESFFAR